MEADPNLDLESNMLTLVEIQRSATSSAEAASLVADYLSFDKRRTSRRQYQKAFGGMAIVVLAGAVFGRVAAGEAELVSAVLLLPVLALAIVEALHWRRLIRHLGRVRAESQSIRKS
jgi:hypothetical protein